jgi:2-phosphosulfolactate phosphatase
VAAHPPSRGVAVVVDVLSFTTTVSVALDRGVEVLPYPWADGGAAVFAADRDATLAVGRSRARPGQVSLSPSTVRAAGPHLRRVVLPSPNGATTAHRLADRVEVVVAGCLRNAGPVASWLTERYGPDGVPVLLVPAGERSSRGRWRAAVEDLWGAGAVVDGLRRHGWVGLSQEAAAAADAWDGVRDDVVRRLRDCASGRELTAMGFGGDVDVASEVSASVVVPRLVAGAFRDVGTRPAGTLGA